VWPSIAVLQVRRAQIRSIVIERRKQHDVHTGPTPRVISVDEQDRAITTRLSEKVYGIRDV
jgi:hypothetical protein